MQRMTRSFTRDTSGRAASASCFASRLSRYADLGPEECQFMARMEDGERSVARGESLMTAGQPAEDLFVLKDGWAVARSRPRNGRSLTLRIYLPGEVIGLTTLGTRRVPHDVHMVTAGSVCPFPRDHMTAVFQRAPRLAALMTALASLDQMTLKDRLAIMGAGTARERMAHFLLDIHERLLFTNPDLGRRFRLPLRQVDIADVLGLTKVYVNRLLRSFTDEGLIQIDRPYVRILRPEVLREISLYENRYDDLDETWFPRSPVTF